MIHIKKDIDKSKKTSKLKQFLHKHMEIVFISIIFLLAAMMCETHNSDTLLPICIPWMYGDVTIFAISIILASLKKIIFRFSFSIMDKASDYLLRGLLAFVLIPAVVLLPNRYIHTEKEKICYGIIVDKTSMPVSKCTDSERNYVKIKLCGENTCFWHNIVKEEKPIGTKCILSVGRGIFGLRYVQDVDFIVE